MTSAGGHRLGSVFAAAIFLGAFAGLSIPSRAVETLFWRTNDPAELSRGEAVGISISAKGFLSLAPRLDRLSSRLLEGEQARPFFWSAALDGAGNLYVGSGDGTVLRVNAAGNVEEVCRLAEPQVTALAVDSAGKLIAGTSPQGAIYGIDPSGKIEVLFDPDERYIWALAIGRDGAIFAGTGERGRIYRVDEKGKGKLFFDSDDPHVVSLAFDRQGRLLAGTDGRGLIMRIDSASGATVLADVPQREIASLSVDGAGNVYAAAFAERKREAPPPALKLRLESTAAGVEERPLQEPMPSLEMYESRSEDRRSATAVLETPGETPGAAPSGIRGAIYRIAPEGTVEEVWSSQSEDVYSVVAGPDGSVWFGTGSPARLRRLETPGQSAVVWNVEQAQITSLLMDSRGRLSVATSNSGAVYRVGPESSVDGTYTSRPIDGGFLARWGLATWESQVPKGARLEIQTRTGSSPRPDKTWSGWSPPLPRPEGSPLTSPPGRYLQWRARLMDGARGSPVLGSLTLSGRPRNRAPRLEEVSVPDAGAAPPTPSNEGHDHDLVKEAESHAPEASAEKRTRWALFRAQDPDGDSLTVRFTAKPLDGPAPGSEVEIPVPEASRSPVAWDDSSLAEGRWSLRIRVSDEKSNPAGTEMSAETESAAFEVDRTPPILTRLPAETVRGPLRIRAVDALSTLSRAEYSRDGKLWREAAVADGILDGREEEILISHAPEVGSYVLRVRDAAGNEARLEITAPP